MANNQSVRRHLDAFTRGRIIGVGGRPQCDKRKRRQTAGKIARHTTQATGRPISRFTVARRLHFGGLFARRPVRCVPLTPAHRRRRSLLCREHRDWRDNEWGRVLFTDESRFSLSSDSHRILIWRERGSRNHPSNIIERDRYGGRGVLVWGGIMLGSRTDLHIFDAGSVNGTRYCNEILLPYVRLFRGAMGLQFLFMERCTISGSQSHRTCMGFLGRRLAARTLPPVTIRELRLALQVEWAAMPQQLIDTLILSMGRRCETCLAAVANYILTPAVRAVFLCKTKAELRCLPRGLLTRKRLSSLLRLNLDSSLKTTWFYSTAVQFSRARYHSKRKRQWVGVKGSSRNRRRDPKCPSARRIRIVQEGTGILNEGATCAWMAADEAVGCTRAFLRCGGLLDD
ncbi:uncharacterized protein TNCV_1913301 [Trichonephila clavipes]|nr:uncharacterized protein TNCV_1913301 [Trichonephila clavipes]